MKENPAKMVLDESFVDEAPWALGEMLKNWAAEASARAASAEDEAQVKRDTTFKTDGTVTAATSSSAARETYQTFYE